MGGWGLGGRMHPCVTPLWMSNGTSLELLCMSWDSLLVRALDSWSKGYEFKSQHERQENFLLQSQLCVLALIWCRSTPVLLQWHIKDSGHFAKSAGCRLHLNMHTLLTQWGWSGLTMLLSRHNVGTLSGSELTRDSSGNTWSQLSQLAELLWTNPSIKNGISVPKLIST